MEPILDVLTSDWMIRLLAAVVAAVWALPRVRRYRRFARQSDWFRLFDLAQVAVMEVWHTYTAERKAAAADGKLTAEEARRARARAATHLRALMAEELPKLVEAYGQQALEAVVARVHAKLQKEGAVE
ncbi:MAG: hypothetical protein ACOC7T_01250 [Planctomycetota bacterium]